MNDAIVADVAGLLEKRGAAFVFARPPDVLTPLRKAKDRGARVAAVDALTAFGHFLATQKKSPDAAKALMTQLESALRTLGDIK